MDKPSPRCLYTNIYASFELDPFDNFCLLGVAPPLTDSIQAEKYRRNHRIILTQLSDYVHAIIGLY